MKRVCNIINSERTDTLRCADNITILADKKLVFETTIITMYKIMEKYTISK